jgi:hypothetical protein
MNRYHHPINGIDRQELSLRPNELTHEPVPVELAKRQAYRQAVLDFVLDKSATHWVTLNTFRDVTLETASRYLKRWRVEVLRRLHGQRFYQLPEDELTYFFGCPEFTQAGHPHFHLAWRVPEPLHDKFIQVATKRWEAIVPSGDVYIELIGPTEADQQSVHLYALKWLDPTSALPFVDSRIYR